jgi:hypothetical protein
MHTQIELAISSLLTWSAYKKLAMSVSWQISPGWTGVTSNFPPLQDKTFVLATGTVHYEVRTHFAMYDIRASKQATP